MGSLALLVYRQHNICFWYCLFLLPYLCVLFVVFENKLLTYFQGMEVGFHSDGMDGDLRGTIRGFNMSYKVVDAIGTEPVFSPGCELDYITGKATR